MGYNITKTHLKHTSFDGPMSVDRQQRNISTPQYEISFHRVQRLHSVLTIWEVLVLSQKVILVNS
jgi:hypothetical protein